MHEEKESKQAHIFYYILLYISICFTVRGLHLPWNVTCLKTINKPQQQKLGIATCSQVTFTPCLQSWLQWQESQNKSKTLIHDKTNYSGVHMCDCVS